MLPIVAVSLLILSAAIFNSLIFGTISSIAFIISVKDFKESSITFDESFSFSLMVLLSFTIILVSFETSLINVVILFADSLLCSARTLISSATTAKPFPSCFTNPC